MPNILTPAGVGEDDVARVIANKMIWVDITREIRLDLLRKAKDALALVSAEEAQHEVEDT